MPTSEPFRLLDLPREVRDAIYHETLCDWPVRGPFRHDLAAPSDRKIQLEPMARTIEPNILLANKMIYQEAKQIFLKGNQFIHIKMVARNTTLITGAFVRSQVPLVARDRDRVALFKDLVVMKHSIDFPQDSSPSPMARIDVIILHRDLICFCVGLGLVDIHSRRFTGQSRHKITMFNPFTKTLSPDFLNIKNQERLLDPYATVLQGLDHVKIEGWAYLDVAKAAVTRMKHEPALPSPNALLERLLHRKGLGDEALLDGDPLKALAHWNAANVTILSARNRRAWPRLIGAAGKDFTDHLSDVVFQIYSNRIQAYLQVAHTDLMGDDSEGPFKTWMKQIFTVCSDAIQTAGILGTDWRPSDDQLARIYYYWAQGHRLAEQDIHFAEHVISRAANLRPNDPEIHSEMKRIMNWRARVGN